MVNTLNSGFYTRINKLITRFVIRKNKLRKAALGQIQRTGISPYFILQKLSPSIFPIGDEFFGEYDTIG